MTLGAAMYTRRGGNPLGPAGTGKTETVKDFGKALARYVIVFNCSDGVDFKMTGKMFSGLAQTGAWACLDEVCVWQEASACQYVWAGYRLHCSSCARSELCLSALLCLRRQQNTPARQPLSGESRRAIPLSVLLWLCSSTALRWRC